MRTLALCLLVTALALSKDKPPKGYPEHGQIIEVDSHSEARGGDVYTDSAGVVRSNPVHRYKIHVWTLRSGSIEYKIESTSPVRPVWMKRALGPGEVADSVDFRLEKGMVYIKYDDKERRYRIVGKRLRDPK